MAMFEVFLTEAGTALNLTSAQAGLVLSLIGTGIFDAVIGIASGSGMAVVVTSILAIVSFTAIGWFPVWSGAVIALVFALIFTSSLRDQL